MFSERCYGERRLREGEYIFCECIFEEHGKTYCYIADTNDYREGDYAVVPAGEDNHQAVVKITSVVYVKAEDAPFPVDKAKHIIGHFDPENDVDLSSDNPVPADKNEKPEGYYDEIQYAWDKKDFLMEHYAQFNPVIRTCKDEEYDYLEENECAVVVKNPNDNQGIEFEMAGEFTLFFAGWHGHYCTYEYDFSEMIKDADRIIKNELCAVVVEVDGNWTSSQLRESSAEISKEKLIEDYEKDHEDSMAARKGVAHVRFWDSSRDYDIILND